MNTSKGVDLKFRVLKTCLFVFFSFIVLCPILITPVIADDYINPFSQVSKSGNGLLVALADCISTVFSGASFRLVGVPLGGLFNWLTLQMSGSLQVDFWITYAITKFLVLLFVCFSASKLLNEFLLSTGRSMSRFPLLVLFSSVFLTSLQLHGYWSNDPVSSYPLSGYFSVALTFMFLTYSFEFLRTNNRVTQLKSLFFGLIAVANYELSLGAVIGMGMFVLVYSWSTKRTMSWSRSITQLLKLQISQIIIGLYVVAGRFITGRNASTYAGTTLRLDSNFVPTLTKALISSFPGSSWILSRDFLGGSVAMSIRATVIAFTIIFAVFVYAKRAQFHHPVKPTNGLVISGVLFTIVFYWFLGTALQSMTIKVQDETPRIGYVYTHYAIGSSVIALVVAIVILSINWNHAWPNVQLFLAIFVSFFLLVQLTINWRLSGQLRASFVPNAQLTKVFTHQHPENERCDALRNWTAGNWPEYYENEMVAGLQTSYFHFHGVSFCNSFVPNP